MSGNRAGNRALAGLLLLSATAVLPGCSLLFTTAPKSAEPSNAIASNNCTTSKAAPIVDTVIAGLQGFRTIYAISTDKSTYDNLPTGREADIAFGVGFFALYTASAIYGYYVTDKCASLQGRAVIVEPPKKPEDAESWDSDGRPRPRPAPHQQWNTAPSPTSRQRLPP